MGSRLLFTVIVSVVLAAAPASQAGTETRTAWLVVRVNVIRTCSVDTRGSGAAEGAVVLTCSRGGSEPGVVSTITGGAGGRSRVVPVPARQMTIVATRPALQAARNAPSTTAGAPTRQVVVLNF